MRERGAEREGEEALWNKERHSRAGSLCPPLFAQMQSRVGRQRRERESESNKQHRESEQRSSQSDGSLDRIFILE
jgi:hypothetical protein